MAFGVITDSAKAREFYVDKLGLTVTEEHDFAIVLDANGTQLRLQKLKEWKPPQHTLLGWRVSDIRATVRELASREVKVEHFGFPGQDAEGVWTPPGANDQVAWFKDPFGNTLSLTQFGV